MFAHADNVGVDDAVVAHSLARPMGATAIGGTAVRLLQSDLA